MLIFHRFATEKDAVGFVACVATRFQLDGAVFADPFAAQRADPIPVELVPPIAHIERTEERPDVEDAVRLLAEEWGGRFVGT